MKTRVVIRHRIAALIVIVLMLVETFFVCLFHSVSARAHSPSATIQYGDYFILGSYLGEEIVWRHIGSDGYGDVALSFRVLTSKAYNSTGIKSANISAPDGFQIPQEVDPRGDRITYGANIWVNSTLRAWLNSAGQVSYIGNAPSGSNITANAYDSEAGFLSNFTDAERTAMLPTKHAAALNEVDIALRTAGTQIPDWGNGANLNDPIRHMVTDTVFLPDAHLLSRIQNDSGLDWRVGYWTTGFHRAGITDSALAQAENPQQPQGEYNAVDYWTGTPLGSQWGGTHQMQIRLVGGGQAFVNVNEGVMGVRPAFYLNHANITITGGSGTQDDPYTIGGGGNSHFDIILYGNTNEKLYGDNDTLRISATAVSDLSLSYITVDPELDISIESETAFNSYAPMPLSPANGKASLTVDRNCTVWVMAKRTGGSAQIVFKSITYKNFYEPVKVYQQGKPKDENNVFLYHPTLINGDYGVPVNKFRSSLTILNGGSYDRINVIPEGNNALPSYMQGYWTRPANSDTQIILDNIKYYNTPQTITMFYEKNSDNWVTTAFYFVDDSGAPIEVNGIAVQPVTIENWVPKGMTPSQVGINYAVPSAADSNLSPYKWAMYDAADINFDTPLSSYEETDNADSIGFDPQMPDDKTNVAIRIYYKANYHKVTVEHIVDGTNEAVKDNGLVTIESGHNYIRHNAPITDRYVVVGYQIGNGSRINLTRDSDGKPQWNPINFQITADITVTYFYAADANGDGIPDNEQIQITARWIGVYSDDSANVLLKTERKMVLKSNTVTVANDSADGNAGHTIDAGLSAKWIFDSSLGLATQTITLPNADSIVRFYYNYDSMGTGIPDKNHGVTIKFAVYDGTGLTYPKDFPEDSFTAILKGNSYIRRVINLTGYAAAGWLLDGETIGDNGLRTFTSGRNGNQVEFETNKPNQTVTIVYRPAAAPVTVRWIGKTKTNKGVEFGKVTVTGYVNETRDINVQTLRASVSVDPASWNPANTTVPASITFSDQQQTFYFYYDEIEHFSYDIHYMSIDEPKTLDEKKISVSTTDSPFQLTAKNFQLYNYVRYEIREFDQPYDRGTDKTITLTPANGALSVYFYYAPETAVVTVKAVESGTNRELLTKTYSGKTGQDFSVSAPYIPGYKLSAGEQAEKTISNVSSANNTIDFRYEQQPAGNVHVILKEDDTNGRIISSDEYTLALGYTMVIPVPDLTFYTALSTAKTVTYTGTDITVEYYYERYTVRIVKRTYDSSDHNRLIGEFDMGMYRVGEIARFYAPSKEIYELDDTSLKLVRIYPPNNRGMRAVTYNQEVSFYYTLIENSGRLVVEAVNENGSILFTDHITGIEGETITVSAPAVPDYKLKPGEPMSQTGDVSGKVTFKYIRDETNGENFADLTIVVKSETNAFLKDADVTAKRNGMKIRINTTDVNGKAVLADLPADTYDITVTCDGYNGFTKSVDLTGDKSEVIRISKSGLDNGGNSNTGSDGNGNSGGNYIGTVQQPEKDKTTPSAHNNILLEKTNHTKYIYGFDDGTVRPNAFITRAETAAVFYRLLKEMPEPDSGRFSDVNSSAWYANAVSALSAIGIINGYPNGTFAPLNTITRAEFAAIISRFEEPEKSGGNFFNDVDAEHWAAVYIKSAYIKGWIYGYPTGEFKPDKPITRAEAVTIINRILGRKIRKEDISDDANIFNDLSKHHWAYADLIEAATIHTYKRDEKGFEMWVTDEQ